VVKFEDNNNENRNMKQYFNCYLNKLISNMKMSQTIKKYLFIKTKRKGKLKIKERRVL